MVMDTNKMYERVSAMQKCIRRGMTEEAGFWCYALIEDGNFWVAMQRLRVTAYEDIGVNDMQAVMFAVKAIDDACAIYKAKQRGWRVAIGSAIIALCGANKGREADHFQAVCRGRYLKDKARQVPDFALDKHTAKGKRMGRGFKHFFEEGAKLEPEHHDRWETEAREYFESGVLNAKAEVEAEEPTQGKFF